MESEERAILEELVKLVDRDRLEVRDLAGVAAWALKVGDLAKRAKEALKGGRTN